MTHPPQADKSPADQDLRGSSERLARIILDHIRRLDDAGHQVVIHLVAGDHGLAHACQWLDLGLDDASAHERMRGKALSGALWSDISAEGLAGLFTKVGMDMIRIRRSFSHGLGVNTQISIRVGGDLSLYLVPNVAAPLAEAIHLAASGPPPGAASNWFDNGVYDIWRRHASQP